MKGCCGGKRVSIPEGASALGYCESFRNQLASKRMGVLPLFDPRDGETVLEPLGRGEGYWVGAPGVIYDNERSKFYLYYRIRVPKPGRGIECRIAQSEDGVHFEDIWSAKKEEFPTSSMERGSLMKCLDGVYRLYVSYVDPQDNRWRTDVMEADSPSGFDLSSRKKVFTASDVGVEGVKDPYVIIIGRLYYMFLSYAPTPGKVDESLRAEMHKTADVYNTGLTKSHSALAISSDGVNYTWLGDIMSPSTAGWDKYASRICSVVYTPPVFTAFYDGSADVSENYEERTGLAISWDLRHFDRVTESGPILISPNARGTLRYMDVLQFDDEIYFYYEYAREDGSHELRLSRVRL